MGLQEQHVRSDLQHQRFLFAGLEHLGEIFRTNEPTGRDGTPLREC
jgi:hypothetical protein